MNVKLRSTGLHIYHVGVPLRCREPFINASIEDVERFCSVKFLRKIVP